MANQKHVEIKKIVVRRQTARWDKYCNFVDFRNGIYECDHVSPFSHGAQNVNAKVMLVLQDWGSVDYLKSLCDKDQESLSQLGRDPTLFTNKNITDLLNRHFHLDLADTYATNLFPFIKQGAMSSSIPIQDLNRAAIEYTKPLIEIIQPIIVICFGIKTFNALIASYGYKGSTKMAEAINRPKTVGTVLIHCLPHPGRLGQNNRNKGGIDRVSEDWAALAQTVNSST